MPGPTTLPQGHVVGLERWAFCSVYDGSGRHGCGCVTALFPCVPGGVLDVEQQQFGSGMGSLFHSEDRRQPGGSFVAVARGWRSPIGDDSTVSSQTTSVSSLDRIIPIWLGLFGSDLWESGVARWLPRGVYVAGVGTNWAAPTGVHRGCCNPVGRFGLGSEFWIWALARVWALARAWVWALILNSLYFIYLFL